MAYFNHNRCIFNSLLICFSLVLFMYPNSSISSQNISGKARTEGGSGIENVQVSLTGPGVALQQLTDDNGDFEFAGLATGQDYELCLSLNSNPLNGVSTFDLELMARHILVKQLLDSPYKIIAAEVGTENLPPDVLDVYLSRQLILGVITSFPAPSWRFIPADHVFPDPLDPFAFSFPEGCKTVSLNGNASGQDFIGVKTGDVNGSAVTN